MLIAMAVYDTKENKRTELTQATLESLRDTVDFGKHRLVVSDNGSCEKTHLLYRYFDEMIDVLILNEYNIGTANAINRAWSHRNPGEAAVKMDNDVVFERKGWADAIEKVFWKNALAGIVGLKRKDLLESPMTESPFYRSELHMLHHEPGEPWMIVEYVNHVMGTCQAYSDPLLQRLGYLYQPGVYGFDDALASVRAKVLGYETMFLHGYPIDHIDPGGDMYTQWKRDQAGIFMEQYHRLRSEYEKGGRASYYDGGDMLRDYLEQFTPLP